MRGRTTDSNNIGGQYLVSWNSYYILCATAPAWPEVDGSIQVPWNWIHLYDQTYLYAERPFEDDDTLPSRCLQWPELIAVSAQQICGWDASTGQSKGPQDDALYEQHVQALGNLPEQVIYNNQGEPIEVIPDGLATPNLRGPAWVGAQQVQLGSSEAADPAQRLYPADNQPFAVEVRHKYFGGNDNPAWDSWGWRAEMLGVSSSRDPTSYAIGIYSDPDCTAYLYTTGAFSEQPSEWQVGEQEDEQGLPIPIQVWATEYNPGLLGQPSETPQDIHHAVLFGSAQEGRATLPGGPEPGAVGHLYWKASQPPRNGNKSPKRRRKNK